MGKQIIETMVKGGKATAGPPLGPALGPLKINTKNVVDRINEKTRDMEGMDVPVKVIVNTESKEFEILVGTPPVSALVKKELNLQKGGGETGIKRVGDLTEEQVSKIARIKFGSDSEKHTSQVKGTCRSMGVTIGKGKVTQEELKRYEEMDKQKEAEEAAKLAAKKVEAPAAGEAPKEEAKEEAAPAKEEKAKEKK